MLGALRSVARKGKWQQVRRMSSGISKEEEIKEMNKWRRQTTFFIKRSVRFILQNHAASSSPGISSSSLLQIITYMAIPVCVAKAAYDLSHAHAHDAEAPDYPYLHIRSKDFPWGPDGLFEKKHEH